MLVSGISSSQAARIRPQPVPVHTINNPTDSSHGKAGRIHSVTVPEKQLHRWIGEGGALLPDDTNFTSTESDLEVAATTSSPRT